MGHPMPDLLQPFRLLLLHQGDAADPELIHWIKDQMDEIFGVGPWGMVGGYGRNRHSPFRLPLACFTFTSNAEDGTPGP